MGLILNLYNRFFLRRFDKDEGMPYYSPDDFPGLVCEEGSFRNSADVPICYYTLHYEGYDPEKLILFCTGIGSGHVEYMPEIETLCRAGYRVLTLDYTGCGSSGGERLSSINAPTRDAMELLDLLQPQEEVIPIGHSLGGYASLNLAHLRPEVTRAVIISGFVSISDEIMTFTRLRPLADIVKRYEETLIPRYGALDNREYLATTTDKLLWIHSAGDPLVSCKHNAGQVLGLGNPNVRVVRLEHKQHHPQYTEEAMKAMYAWTGEYRRLLRRKKLVTLEERKAFFADKPLERMTAQDPAVYEEILRFIEG